MSKENSVVVGKWKEDAEICLRCNADRTALREMITEGGKSNLTIVNHILKNCPACEKAPHQMLAVNLMRGGE